LQTTAPSAGHVAILEEAIGNTAPKAVPIDCGDVVTAVIDREALEVTSVVTVYAGTGTTALEALGAYMPPGLLIGRAAVGWETAAIEAALPVAATPSTENAFPQPGPLGAASGPTSELLFTTSASPGSGNLVLNGAVGIVHSDSGILATNMSGS
jgi:hypothetical protein